MTSQFYLQIFLQHRCLRNERIVSEPSTVLSLILYAWISCYFKHAVETKSAISRVLEQIRDEYAKIAMRGLECVNASL